MSSQFFNESEIIANNFIKTICFIDDQPIFGYEEDPVNEELDHRLNANIITKSFALTGKSCSFYRYQNIEEEPSIINLAKNTDVNIIDWRIFLEDHVAKEVIYDAVTSTNERSVYNSNEEDVEGTESRGKYALRLIERILSENYDSPKLIIVFTAEYIVEAIFNPIKQLLDELNIICDCNEDQLCFTNERFRISIYFKPIAKDRHLSDIVRNKTVVMGKLPEIVNHEFAMLTQGLVLSTALKCITEVRSNTFSLLGSYNKNLDPAFFSHKSLLPNPYDAEDQLIDIIGSDIKAILKGCSIAAKVRDDLLPKYIEQNYHENTYPLIVHEIDKLTEMNLPSEITSETLKSILINGVEKTFIKKEQPMDQQMLFQKSVHLSLTDTFVLNADSAIQSNIAFAFLTTIKPQYQLKEYILTQGTILQEERKDNYWLCIQPKCDSVRIETQKRQFLFLKLTVSNLNSFNIVVNKVSPVFLKINYKLYYAKTIDFKINMQHGNASYTDTEGIIKFDKVDNLKMIWIAELKNDYSQSIVNRFSSELSRVGLDLSEWLRRNSN